MSASLIVANGVNWAIQILLLVAVAGFALALLRVSDPRVRLRTWHAAVFLSPLLPVLGPWRATPAGALEAVASGGSHAPAVWHPWLLGIVVTGAVVRMIWLSVGMAKLGGLRRRAAPWCPGWLDHLARAIGASATVGSSQEISSAVTFGVRSPSILVPEALRAAAEPHQRAVVAHELHHVARRDWLWVLAEESVRTVLWWHPAIWFAVSEARLAREEIVDRQVIAATRNRTGYLEALVAAADARGSSVAGVVSHFYRRRQLKSRIRRLLKETNMSPRRILASAMVIGLALPATVWAASGAFPIVSGESTAVTQEPPPPPPPPPPPAPRSPRPVTRQEQLPPPPPPPPPPARRVTKSEKAPSAAGVPGGVVGGVPDGVPDVAGPPPPPARKRVMQRPASPPPPPPAPPRVVRKGGGEDVPPPPPPPPPPPKVIKKDGRTEYGAT